MLARTGKTHFVFRRIFALRPVNVNGARPVTGVVRRTCVYAPLAVKKIATATPFHCDNTLAFPYTFGRDAPRTTGEGGRKKGIIPGPVEFSIGKMIYKKKTLLNLLFKLSLRFRYRLLFLHLTQKRKKTVSIHCLHLLNKPIKKHLRNLKNILRR